MNPTQHTHLTTPRRRRRTSSAGEEMHHFVKALSHDMSANLMLLESSFRQVKESCSSHPIRELAAGLAHVEACLKQSKRFLDDLIALGTTGSVQMEPQQVKMQALVQQVMYEQEELFQRRGVRVHVAGALPDVWCNESRVKQVVTNLVRNAAIHGCDDDLPEINISHPPARPIYGTARPAAVGRRLWFRIHDNGPGIPVHERENVFLPGSRLSSQADGSGMGLAIVRKIVEHFGGQACVDPDCLRGTAMLFSLPALPEDRSGRQNVQ
jgi:signal transduction histidine kinase